MKTNYKMNIHTMKTIYMNTFGTLTGNVVKTFLFVGRALLPVLEARARVPKLRFISFFRKRRDENSSRRCLTGMIALGLVSGMAWSPSIISGQEDNLETRIEIVNQDGEEVTASEIEINQPKIVASPEGARVNSGVAVQRKDGKLIVTDDEGNQHEVDVEGAQSIIVNQSVKSVTENGEMKTKRVGKAIIIGRDGKRHEIDLGGPINGDQFNFAGVVHAEHVDNSFMIGVNCEPVSEALSTQLELETGTGLAVLQVGTGSPAEAAGVENHDVLMFADDRQLKQQSDLVEAVQTAGKEKTNISLTIIRGGKEIGVDVAPVERPESALPAGIPQVFRAFPNLNGRGLEMQFRQMGPGLIVDNLDQDFHKQMEDQMKEMRAHMEQLQKQMEQQRNEVEIK